MDGRDVDGFMGAVDEGAAFINRFVRERANILLVGHNDADAISALGIMAGTLRDLEAPFTARSISRIDELLSRYVDGEYDLLIMLDMGSGYLPELKAHITKTRVAILDHHKPAEEEMPDGWIQVNPHPYGIDGATEISASGVSYLVAKRLSPESVRYAPVAIVGALGDLQDKDGGRRLRGLNRRIVEEASEAGLLAVSEDLILYGRGFRPIHQAMASTYSPFIPGLSGDENASLSLVVSSGIEIREGESWRTLRDLNEDEKRRLYNAILAHVVSSGYPSSIVSELVGEVYELTGEDEWTSLRDAREYATLLNACGKTGKNWVGIAVAMGMRGSVMEEAQKTHESYRQVIARAMEFANRKGAIEHMHNISILRGGTEIDIKQISSVASILSSSQLLPSDKPLIAMAQEGSLVKVSARANRALTEAGLDLGLILSEASRKFGGRGGGHKVAAGAEIEADRLTLFLLEVDRLVGEAIGRRGQVLQTNLDER